MELTYHEFHKAAERIAAQDANFKAAYDKSGHDIMGFMQYFMAVCGHEYIKQQGRHDGGAAGDTHELDVQSHMVHYFTDMDAKPTDMPIESLITFKLDALKNKASASQPAKKETTTTKTKQKSRSKKSKVVSMDPHVVSAPDDSDDWGMDESESKKQSSKKTTKPKAKPIVEDDDDDWGM